MFQPNFEPFSIKNVPKLKNNSFFQKLSQAVLISVTSAAVPFHGNVRRNLQGSWIDSLDRTLSTDRTRRAEIDGELGFQTLATMMLYMNGFGADLNNPELHNQYNNKVAELKVGPTPLVVKIKKKIKEAQKRPFSKIQKRRKNKKSRYRTVHFCDILTLRGQVMSLKFI